MWIQDLTKLLNTGALNYYTFNPSILFLKDDLYLIAYRIASYDLPMAQHCWKVWNSSYKLFKDPKTASTTKYREFLGPAIKHELKSSSIHQKFPEMKFYEVSETEVKVPAGWLIEQAGFKGKRFGDAGIHKNQALVLVNYGNATGQEILNVSKEIQKTIFEKYGIHIEAEVNVI